MIKVAYRSVAIVATVLTSICLFFLLLWVYFIFTPIITTEQGYHYTVPSGASMHSVVLDLYSLNIIKFPRFFNVLVAIKGNKKDLKAGEYLFAKGTTPYHLLYQITTGTGMIYYSFTIIDGWTFKQLRQALLHEDKLRHLSADLSDKDIMQHLQHPEMNPEGEFFPDTYYFSNGSSDLALLKRAFRTMQHKLALAWQERDADLPFQTPKEALIAASLVEKEAYLEQEKPIIAGVLINRLKNNMLLQIDPTVIYAMGATYKGKLHKEDLLFKNPYNTYLNKGLPPSPIAMPNFQSIKAIMHPEHHDFYYYVAKGDGTHQFSKTLRQHELAIMHAKSYHPAFFNFDLTRYYLLKITTNKVTVQ